MDSDTAICHDVKPSPDTVNIDALPLRAMNAGRVRNFTALFDVQLDVDLGNDVGEIARRFATQGVESLPDQLKPGAAVPADAKKVSVNLR